MITTQDLDRVRGTTVYDTDVDKIGTAQQVYLDDDTGQPQWVTVNTGLFGTSESFVPLSQADMTGDGLRVPYDKKTVKDAPRLDDDGHISPEQEEQLYRHYEIDLRGETPAARTTDVDDRGTYAGVTTGDDGMTGTGTAGAAGTTGTTGHDTSGPTTDDAMTRSEERLHVGTEQREAGRARLRKYVTPEHQTVDVPVTREEVRVEREPITDANRGDAQDGPALSEEEHEVVLHEERPVVGTETVPVERVRLDKETHTDTEQVSADVRKEQIETEGDDTARR
ncbi:PRC and DUF2382 domain-containing protein [Aquipuribacter sp. SD81]|uniref:PRC and DUF2382 domain-containing protein n=1 Tax=Aquipuribacter sp. SD81 TaxID=3127703 RepID=UPI0030164DB4